jgi:hypothetical protein
MESWRVFGKESMRIFEKNDETNVNGEGSLYIHVWMYIFFRLVQLVSRRLFHPKCNRPLDDFIGPRTQLDNTRLF